MVIHFGRETPKKLKGKLGDFPMNQQRTRETISNLAVLQPSLIRHLPFCQNSRAPSGGGPPVHLYCGPGSFLASPDPSGGRRKKLRCSVTAMGSWRGCHRIRCRDVGGSNPEIIKHGEKYMKFPNLGYMRWKPSNRRLVHLNLRDRPCGE